MTTDGSGPDASGVLGVLMAACKTPGQRDALRAMSARLDQLTEVERRAQRMLDHGTPLSQVFAATVLGVDPIVALGAGGRVRPDGTAPPQPATAAHDLAQHQTGQLADVAVGQVDRERGAADYRKALGIIDALLAGGPGQPTNWTARRADATAADDRYNRERVADLRHVRTVLYVARENQQVVDQLAPLCPCSLDPEADDGPQQDCPIHGDRRTFVELCRWRDRVVGGAHALLGALDADRPDVVTDVPAVERMRDLLDAGPWASPMSTTDAERPGR
jgi:hypothetical protein